MIAIGETGPTITGTRTRPSGSASVSALIRVSRGSGKPLIIHTPRRVGRHLRLMREEGPARGGGVMRFTETQEVADAALALGFKHFVFRYRDFPRNAKALKEVARQVPLERLLIETGFALSCARAASRPDQPAFMWCTSPRRSHVSGSVGRRGRPLEHRKLQTSLSSGYLNAAKSPPSSLRCAFAHPLLRSGLRRPGAMMTR